MNKSLQVRMPTPEAIHIPLEQLPEEWRGSCTLRRKSAMAPRQAIASIVFCLALGVPLRLVCESDESEGCSLRSGTMIVSHSFFRVPERDRKRHIILWLGLGSIAGPTHIEGHG
jgi:hypothetical protein